MVRRGLFIPTHNVASPVIDVLESISVAARERFTRIYLIDNQSADATLEKLQDFIQAQDDDRLRLYLNEENYSLGGSTIMVFELALNENLDYVICLHSDGQASSEA